MEDMRTRYLRDPLIRRLVDVLEDQIASLNLTPSEIRECAVLAAIHHEMSNTRPVMVPREWVDQLTAHRRTQPTTEKRG